MSYRSIFNRLTDVLSQDKHRDKTNQALQHLFGQIDKNEREVLEDMILIQSGMLLAVEEQYEGLL